jgi:hypothetical protein
LLPRALEHDYGDLGSQTLMLLMKMIIILRKTMSTIPKQVKMKIQMLKDRRIKTRSISETGLSSMINLLFA